MLGAEFRGGLRAPFSEEIEVAVDFRFEDLEGVRRIGIDSWQPIRVHLFFDRAIGGGETKHDSILFVY